MDYRKFLSLAVAFVIAISTFGVASAKSKNNSETLQTIEPLNLAVLIQDDLVSQVDDLCIKHGAFRYMHSKTVKDPERRRQLDLNSRFAQQASAAVKSASH